MRRGGRRDVAKGTESPVLRSGGLLHILLRQLLLRVEIMQCRWRRRRSTGAQAAVPIFIGFMQEANKYYASDDFKPPANAKFAMVRGIREAFRPGTEPRVADLSDAAAAGPQPYNKVFQNGLTGAPNAASAVPPVVPPKPPVKKDDVSGLY